MDTKHPFNIYDLVRSPAGNEFQILQVRPDSALVLPSAGGISQTITIEELSVCQIISSPVGELKELSLTEKWRRIIDTAKERWREHSMFSKKSKKSISKSGTRTISIDLGDKLDKI